MAKPILQKKPPLCTRLWIAAAASLLILIPLLTFAAPWLRFSSQSDVAWPPARELTSFYDEPGTTYTTGKPVANWDEKRRQWFKLHPQFSQKENRVVVITGSQASPCTNPGGDHLLLRFFKNKVDYCRIHGYEILYNNAYLHPAMTSYWAKIPVIRAAMVAHPEAEWLFWIDSDAAFTDMDFEIPFERYKDYNLVVHGWPEMIYVNRSWVGLNAGVFLMRNCDWSMEFLEVWAGMGPASEDFEKWGVILREKLSDKVFPAADDQSALVYAMVEGERRWRERIYVENEYALHGYWIGIVGRFEEYAAAGRRRRAELGRRRKGRKGRERRPFVTHFTGCQPCSGEHNPAYKGDTCRVGMERALNFADNQVLRSYGFVHPDLRNNSLVKPLPF